MLTIRRCAGCGKEFDAEVGTPDRVCFACRDVLGDWDGAGSEEKIRDEGICNRRGETWEEQAQRMARGADTKSDSIDSALRSLSRAYPKKRYADIFCYCCKVLP